MRNARAGVVTLVLALLLPWCAGSATGPAPLQPLTGAAEWSRQVVDGVATPDPESADPRVVAEFFASLRPQQAEELAERFPFVVGNLDGAPATLRYAANRRALAQERSRLRAVAADVEEYGPARDSARHLAAVYGRLARDGRPILVFDPRGRGRYAEVHGDLERAEHVAVMVPGTGITLRSFDPRSDHVGTPGEMGAALYAAQRALTTEPATAVIAWAGYDTPQALGVGAATATHAEAGAVLLNRLVEGLHAARAALDGTAEGGEDSASTPGRPAAPTASARPSAVRLAADSANTSGAAAPPLRLALFCHSYGSVVCGRAAAGLPVQDVVFFGSPGVGVDSADELNTDARVWAARGPQDWIRHVPNVRLLGFGHGRDPSSAAFGARRVPAARVAGHDGYLRGDSDAARWFTRISLGLAAEPYSPSNRTWTDAQI
ncbi:MULTISPECIES: alpha/beta hydrolase [Actinoalloteichus]|uniref:Alpha/beta hydrolase n=1 Tax=Actinoalloteichus fjordicus TaxID=1612552 RepID=A0AAC9LBX7_9PSEU|nr:MULTISPECIES: alpha/beta hydrolase [Actinoalloteichus]APU14094.1 Alpha/beta hydrolase [Actinoalloteichus fjordicus]APU20041.1 Alpha/beta hydrolase [Actinoalloteichus sp. GBA129-24]